MRDVSENSAGVGRTQLTGMATGRSQSMRVFGLVAVIDCSWEGYKGGSVGCLFTGPLLCHSIAMRFFGCGRGRGSSAGRGGGDSVTAGGWVGGLGWWCGVGLGSP